MTRLEAALIVLLFTIANGLKDCLKIPSFVHHYVDNSTKQKLIHGACNPSQCPGAFYTDDNTDVWSCWGPDFLPSWRTDEKAKEEGKAGACEFKDFTIQRKPADVKPCSDYLNYHPSSCAPGPSVYWGACWSSYNDNWMPIPKDNKNFTEQTAAGDCKAFMIMDTAAEEGQLYTDACRFTKEKPHPWKCDTVSTYSKSDGGKCGEDVNQYDSACWTLTKGVTWQCFSKDSNISVCDWTPNSAGQFYDGYCLFKTNKGYKHADEDPKGADFPHPETKTTTTGKTTITTTAMLATTTTTAEGGGDKGGGFPSWVIVLIVLALAALAIGLFLCMRSANGQTPTVTTRSALDGNASMGSDTEMRR